jgi:hypothetical protein
MGAPKLDRRQLLGASALLATAVGAPLAIWWRSDQRDEEGATDRHHLIMSRVADLVIPPSDTPGAAATGVAAFVITAFAHGLDGTRAPASSAAIQDPLVRTHRGDGSLDYLDWLADELDRRTHGDFPKADRKQQVAALEAIDAAAYPPGPPPPPGVGSPWVKIKGLILTGYYTSEIGGSKELRYELVPGRFDPDLPLQPGDRAWSSDWTAVEFG